MQPLPTAESPTQRKDREQLRLLTLFHFILSGLSLIGIGFIALHFFLMRSILTSPQVQNAKGGPPPEQIFRIFIIVYIVFACLLVISSGLNLASGICLRRRRLRMFSMVIGGLNCLQVPFGTALGVFTFIVLSRESVRDLYLENGEKP